tara:strand:- start:1880 stop:3046 length:1167 start_codon:yes stop_codon:yes gene_type:complete
MISRLKNSTAKFLLFLISIYLPCFIYSNFEYYFRKESSSSLKEVIDEINQKIFLVKSNYLPVVSPFNFFPNIKDKNIYPIGSIPNKNSYFCNEGYGLISYKTDRFGLRNPNKKWDQILKNDNIFLVGDSFVHGACVPEYATLSSIIEKGTGLNTLNLGSFGNDPYEYMAILNSIVKPILNASYKDNKVIIFFYSNDNINLNKRKKYYINSIKSIIRIENDKYIYPIKKYDLSIKKIYENNFSISKDNLISSIRLNTLKKSYYYYVFSLFPIRNKIRYFFYKRNYLTNLDYLNPTEESIVSLSKICKKSCQPIIVYIPSKKGLNTTKINNKYKNQILSLAKKENITFIDGEKVVDLNLKIDIAPKGQHLSITGYEKLSKYIIKSVKNIK